MTRSDARSLLLLALAIVPILLTGWFSYNQWSDAGRELQEIEDAVAPVAAAHRSFEIFDRLGRSELLIAVMELDDPPAAAIAMQAQDQETFDAELDARVEAFQPYVSAFAAQLGQTEELANELVKVATSVPALAIQNYEVGDASPLLIDLVLRPARDGLHDMVPVIVSSSSDEEQLLETLMVLDHTYDLDLLMALRGRLDGSTMRLAGLRLPTWDAGNEMWTLEFQELATGANLAELVEVGSLASTENPLAPPLLTLVEVGIEPSPRRDAAIVAALANDLDLSASRANTFADFVSTAEDRSAELRRGRILAILAGLAMTGLAIALLRLVVSEIAERRHVARAHNKVSGDLAEQANRDALTGLRNRRWLDRALPQLLNDRSDGEEIALAYLDVDRFKTINDVWGHHNGDLLLRIVAERLQAAAATLTNVELVRFGGDEFVALATMQRNVSDAVLESFGAALLEAFEEPVSLDGKHHEIQSSVGVALTTADSTMHSLLVDADLSMLHAKQAGRGRVVVDTSMEGRVSELVQAVPAALADGEFAMHLQPVVSARTGAVHHYEALARWTRANGEQVSPAVFVPLIESFGLADDLTTVMLANVAALRRSGRGEMPRIWVNVSPVEFNGPNLANRILRRLDDLGISPNAIGIEMTERSAIGDLVGVEDELLQLRASGVKIAIDDFGAGYSPLGHLRDLPVDVLKIDRALVSRIDQDAGAVEIVRGIIGFGRSLGLTILAEGVETEEERRVLCDEGVDLIQGWLTGRPGPPEEVLPMDLHRNDRADPDLPALATRPGRTDTPRAALGP